MSRNMITSGAALALSLTLALSIACTSMMGVGGPDLAGSLYGSVTRSESVPGVVGSKAGQSCQKAYLALVANGDASIEAAAKNAGITKVSSVSFERTNVLGSIYQANCTRVTGN